MALLNITLFVTNYDTVCEDLLLGFPVLLDLGIDSRTLLQQNWSSLNGTHCTDIDGCHAPSAAGRLGRLILAQMKRDDESQSNEPLPNRPRANYFDHKHTANPFLNHFLFDSQDEPAKDLQYRKDVEELLARAMPRVSPRKIG